MTTAVLHRLPASWSEFVQRLGNTPLTPIEVRFGARRCVVLLKREEYNPLGSIKDRTAYGLVLDAEARRAGRKPLTVVESTSGNLGGALAAACALRGHTFIAVVDPKMSAENLELMRQYGACVELVTDSDETGNYLTARIARVRRIRDRLPCVHWTNQYANPANPMVHYRTTGPELVRQANASIDAAFVAVSTGGTLGGVGRYLHATSPRIRVVAVDADGSIALGGTAGSRRLTGIGANRRSVFVTPADYDEVRRPGDATAVATCRWLASQTGLRLGGSSGFVLAACLEYLAGNPTAGRLACLCPDGGGKYADTVYDDGWLAAKGIDPRPAYAWLSAFDVVS
jgi:2,3-diaminopropionate biosynthesis protein SbnA